MTVTVIGDNTGDDFSGTEDAEMRSNAPTSNFSTATVQLRNYTPGLQWVGLLSFSGLSNIAASEVVSDATLNQYFSVNNSSETQTTAVQRCLRNWVEAQATYDDFATSNAWTSGGAQSNGNDRSATISATITYGSTGVYVSANDAQLTSDVADFVSGALSNYGWVQTISGQSVDSSDRHTFVGSTQSDGQRPYLSVTHAAGGVTDEIVSASFVITPSAVGSLNNRVTQAATTAFALTPSVIGSLNNRVSPIDTASFAITPNVIDSIYNALAVTTQAESASFTLTPATIGSLYNHVTPIDAATFALSPSVVGVLYNRATQIDPTSFIITPGSVTLSTSLAPTVPGMEWTLPVNRLHYGVEGRMHYTLPLNRLHYTKGETDV